LRYLINRPKGLLGEMKMAVTKTDCEAIGEQMYRDGKERPEGNSWQVKAQQTGYDRAMPISLDEDYSTYPGSDMYDEKPLPDAEFLHVTVNHTIKPMKHNKPSIPASVATHINKLCEMARTESNFARCQRLMSKANKLAEKWKKRAFPHDYVVMR
jgi:hypothetical protein